VTREERQARAGAILRNLRNYRPDQDALAAAEDLARDYVSQEVKPWRVMAHGGVKMTVPGRVSDLRIVGWRVSATITPAGPPIPFGPLLVAEAERFNSVPGHQLTGIPPRRTGRCAGRMTRR
jgi:hypothetical protein